MSADRGPQAESVFKRDIIYEYLFRKFYLQANIEKDSTELIMELRQSGWFAIIKQSIEHLQLLLQCVETDDDQTAELASMVLDN